MILRRLARHVQSQNWTAVALDFLIVVVGVFVGLQAQDWHEALQSRSAYTSYLARIAKDLDLSISVNEDFRRQALEIATLGRDAVEMLEACEIPPERAGDFASALYLSGKADMPLLRTDALDEMRSTGRGSLLDAGLRTAIGNLEHDQARADALSRRIDTRMDAQLQVVSRHVRFDVDETQVPAQVIEARAAHFDFAALCANEAFINSVAGLTEQNYRIAIANARRLENQREVRALVTERLARSNEADG